ncbi:M20/M25/M40 family metallo-hydrolase [Halegenticoccus soli]|uniref:M20/M25/M40 family metallo-hydrolase n=1 Tax=Halegenticoccus soli TaxID=1985678 RepID=UPI000C6EDA4C|nr:M20/M25/M40 family metallo-hydrolase [Halegenticoccus soli]
MSFDPIAFLESAVRIASHEEVGQMRDFLVGTLADHGVEADVDRAGNVVASRGSGSPHLVLNTHIDTVPPHVPYEREPGVIRGRGSCDAKGPLAALLAAFLAVDPREDGEGGRISLAVTPDEERLSTGAAALTGSAGDSPFASLVRGGDAFVVGEPTGLDVCNAAKGRFEGTIRLSGSNAHAAEPDSGANAVAAAERALSALRTFDADREPHPSLGPATLTPTVIEGGEATNQVPAECRIVVDRRSVPPETAEGFREALGGHLREAVPAEIGVEFRLAERETPFLEAFTTPEGDPLVRTLADAAARASDGAGGGVRPFTAATEASYFAPAPTVVFGPGALADDAGAVAHSDREYVNTDEVRAAAEAVETTLRATLADG